MGFEVVLLVASMLISYALRPKPAQPKAATLEEFDLPQPEEGTPQCVVFGDVWIPDWTVLAYGNLRTSKIQTSSGK